MGNSSKYVKSEIEIIEEIVKEGGRIMEIKYEVPIEDLKLLELRFPPVNNIEDWCKMFKIIFEKGNITSQQFNILRILRGATEPLSTLQIRQRMLDKMSDTSRIVVRLIAKDLVKKVVCKTDKRLVDVTITEKGMKLLEELDKFESDVDAVLGSLSNSEVETLNILLDKIRNSN